MRAGASWKPVMRATIENIAGVPTRFLHHGSGDYGVLMLHGLV